MAIQTQTENLVTPVGPRTGRRNAGIILVGIGLFLFLGQLLPEHTMGMLILPMLGGIVPSSRGSDAQRRAPGAGRHPYRLGCGRNAGGAAVADRPGAYKFVDTTEAGIIMLSIAGGFALVSILSPFVGRRFHVWPLFPTAILASIGGLLLMGDEGVRLLVEYGKYWPIMLIALGGLMLFRRGDW